MSVIIKDIAKANNEIIRIEISEFKGKELINIRIWYQSIDNNGNVEYKPTQKGVAINVSQFNELRDGIEKINNYLKDKESGTIVKE
jgi:predicted transcriptional regulator